MPTCPNCGSIIMEGDPYCTHCGASLKWDFEDEEDYYTPGRDPGKDKIIEIFDRMKHSDYSTDERFDFFKDDILLPEHMLETVRSQIHDEEERFKCKFIMVHVNDYPQVYIFLREDKFRDVMIYDRCHIEFMPDRFDPDEREFHYIYAKLEDNPKFRRQVEKIERKGMKFRKIFSDIYYPRWENDIEVQFIDGDDIVYYLIDDDLNFRFRSRHKR